MKSQSPRAQDGDVTRSTSAAWARQGPNFCMLYSSLVV